MHEHVARRVVHVDSGVASNVLEEFRRECRWNAEVDAAKTSCIEERAGNGAVSPITHQRGCLRVIHLEAGTADVAAYADRFVNQAGVNGESTNTAANELHSY